MSPSTGKIVTPRSKLHPGLLMSYSYIAKDYLCRWFLVDFISAFPFDFVLLPGTLLQIKALKVLRLIRVNKVMRMLKVNNIVMVFSKRLNFNYFLSKGISLTVMVLSFGHLIACLWWGICSVLSTSESWIDNSAFTYSMDMRSAQLFDQYVISMYFSFVTLLGIGYGDIVPGNTAERLLCCAIMFVGSTVLINFVLAAVVEIVNRLINGKAHLDNQMLATKEYLVDKKVPKSLSDSILRFLAVKNEIKSIYDERQLVSVLPTHIRDEIMFVQHFKALQKIPIFKYISNRSMTIYIYNMLRVTYFDKNEYIFHEGIPLLVWLCCLLIKFS